MVISSHFIAGAALGKATGNPILAVVFGFVLHFVMDLVPHWNYGYKHLKKVKTLLLVLMDPLLAFALYLTIGLIRGYSASTWLVTFLGGFFCALPDLIEFFIRVFNIKPLIFFLKFHRAVHWFDPHPENIWATAEDEIQFTKKGTFFGILYQIPFVIIAIYFLLH
ncbi:MAG TPA: hypothetical protein P5096_01615 [Patescibacteria group bacterium]|nr:hypothetical protein [Patescibacteria group bacterium]